MANGSYRLDLKRDDARTLMLKMDARLTYAGRERNVAYQLEGDRELRHIDCARQLINADFNRAKRDIQRRIDFFQALQEQNRERQKRRNIAWCDEEEKDWERKARAARRRGTLPKLKVHINNHKAEVVGSIRRDQKGQFANKMTHEMNLNRSLDALTNDYTKHKSLSERNKLNLEHTGKKSIKPRENLGEPTMSKSKHELPTQTVSLPELPVGKALPCSLSKKSSLSQMISSGEFCKLPGIVMNEGHQPTAAPPRRRSIVRSFYMNTSTNQQGMPSNFKSGRRASIVYPSTKTNKKRVPTIALGPQQSVPLRFYETEENPFLKGGFTPTATNRSYDLIHADKADEMYIWLGFNSAEEYDKLKRGELELEFDDDECSDTSSNADKPITSSHKRELMEMGDTIPAGTPKDLPGGTESKLGAPRIMIATAGGAHNMEPLERFANAANMVMVVRRFQKNLIE